MAYELAIIGGGNMGAALLGGLLQSGVAPDSLVVCETVKDRRAVLASRFPGVGITDAVPVSAGAVLAVKPGDVPSAARTAATAGARRLLSIAAGVTTTTIETAAAEGSAEPIAVVRAMPNTPALVGEGASAIAAGRNAGDDDLAWAEVILGAVGLVVRVDESDLDAVTALSGSGPAYLFLVAEALTDAGASAGLDRDLATALTTQLLSGAAKLLATRGDAAALRREVTSPGGTTEAGLAELDAHGVRDAFVAAVAAAAARSRELANE